MTAASLKFEELYREARSCYEAGKHRECEALLDRLSDLRVGLFRRRRAANLMLDFAYQTDRRENFLAALDSRYVTRSLGSTNYDYWCKLSALPLMETVWPGRSVTLPLRQVGPVDHSLYGVDVTVNGRRLLAVIDNCAADYCDITTDLAVQLGVRPIGKKIRLNGNRRKRAYIGMVDTLTLGDLVLNNVLFSVSDRDEALAEEYPFDVILGANVLRRTGDMILNHAAKTVTFSLTTLDLPQNVFCAYPGHGYYVDGLLDEKEISMLLDFGCTNTNLNKHCYSSQLKGNVYPESSTTSVNTLENTRFAFCGAVCELPRVNILLRDNGAESLSGKLGTDILRRYRLVVFNARKQYLKLFPE